MQCHDGEKEEQETAVEDDDEDDDEDHDDDDDDDDVTTTTTTTTTIMIFKYMDKHRPDQHGHRGWMVGTGGSLYFNTVVLTRKYQHIKTLFSIK